MSGIAISTSTTTGADRCEFASRRSLRSTAARVRVAGVGECPPAGVAQVDIYLAKCTMHIGFGFRKSAHYRLRVLLYAGRPNWDQPPRHRHTPLKSEEPAN